jgi:tetratricopeptide (TPR) repeat protein
MARASEQEQKGSTGVSEVTAKFTRLEWGFAEITRHDNGSDLFLMARDARRFDLGLTVGAQVKAGPTYFKYEERGEDGQLEGWWFRDPDGEHVNDWLKHGLPHLIVIHNLDTRMTYWVHVTEDAVVSTGKGSKVLVPIENTVDEEHRDALLAVAATLRPAAMWEGSAWKGAGSLQSNDVLRHALVVPRLIAPHPNARVSEAITPAQGVALLMQARLQDLDRFSSEHDQVPTLDEAQSSSEWSWRFFGALGQRITSGDVDILQSALTDAPDPAARVAATVTAAAGLLEEDRPDEAIALLKAALDEDEADPVDHAWLTVQHARALAEIGRLDEARAAAAAVQSLRATYPNDVTATAIAGVGAQLLFSLSRWGEGDLARAVVGADTAASWWRQQTTAWGLAASLERTFQGWARDTTQRWAVSDEANDQLLAAALTATLVGAQGDWRNLSGLLGRDTLLRVERTTDPAVAHAGLSTLRLAGAKEALQLAVRRLVADGPAAAVTAAAADVHLDASTKTTGPTNLTLLRYGGTVLDEATADRTVSWLLTTLTDPVPFTDRTTPSYLVPPLLVDTLAAVVPAASAGARESVVAYLLELPPQQDQLMAQSWARIVLAGVSGLF